MQQDSALIEQRHRQFISEIAAREVVWALQCKEGYATSTAHHFEDEEGGELGMLCFWSTEQRASACIGGEWSRYRAVEIGLPDFLEHWCLGMYQENWIVGTNFDASMFGHEVEPLELILEIGRELKVQEKALSLARFESTDDLLQQVRELLQQENEE